MTIGFLAWFYPWTKAFHVISVIAWMAGMLYLPRLYVYHCDLRPGTVESDELGNARAAAAYVLSGTGSWAGNVQDEWNTGTPEGRAAAICDADISGILCGAATIGANISSPDPASAGNMQRQVERGQAPKSVDRVDPARAPFEQPNVHFKDGSCLNSDGTWKHGGRPLTNAEKNWLMKNNW